MSVKLPKVNAYKQTMYDFTNVDYEELNSKILEVDWNSVISENIPDVNASAEAFMSTLTDVIKMVIPSKVVTIRPRDKPWMTCEIRRLLRRKRRRYGRYKKTNNSSLFCAFKRVRNNCIDLIRKAKRNHRHSLCLDLANPTSNPKKSSSSVTVFCIYSLESPIAAFSLSSSFSIVPCILQASLAPGVSLLL